MFCIFSHTCLPDNIMKTAIVPIIENKTGDSREKTIIDPVH